MEAQLEAFGGTVPQARPLPLTTFLQDIIQAKIGNSHHVHLIIDNANGRSGTAMALIARPNDVENMKLCDHKNERWSSICTFPL
jgi:hypothetical protein